ncbi:2-keto-4-pentenoate hydratase [Hyphococcus luteus]|uniref:2-keto-4-pentenoate hydratase n=1 Tax=Hyphococcus luteus TaxID=2058213 RepID=A0A2S7KA99_9PROT|nr:fumarylacetoacetate hydrolase family protein [Marinicaulis flavus]PQA89401.1 2-keto-4-pentenoate hydratase [Marinicaulis flavus]
MNKGEDTEKVSSLARRLRDAETSRMPIAPLTDIAPDMTLQEAYEVQKLNIDARTAAGERVVGHKIGLTAKAMQEMFGVDEPDYGHLMNTMMHDPKQPLDLSSLIDPQIEVEPAFILASDLKGPGVTLQDVLDATAYVATCFEIIDSRIANWRIRLQDTVADNGSSALVVLGEDRISPRDLPLDDLETTLEIDGEVVETGNTKAILGHPGSGVAWLANALAPFGGGLAAGDIVLPGTCTRSYRLAGHSQARGDIDRLGAVSVTIVGEPCVASKKQAS